jgi:serine/threonine-protein kinase
VLQDSEVYRADDAAGHVVAIKIARPEAADLRRALSREAAILSLLDGEVAPRLIGHGSVDGRAYVAVEWIEARDVLMTAQTLHARGETDHALRLGGRLLNAYAAVHARGVFHGDVHPRNALVAADGSVRLIDFGLADSRSLPRELRPHERGGVGFFLEPEFALARLDNRRPPRLNAPGEQYSVAALLYLVLTGAHYLRFSPEKEAMRRQIVEEEPLAFADAGLGGSESAEAVLRHALAKEPARRFGSGGELATAFRAAARTDRRRRRRKGRDPLGPAADALIEALIARAAPATAESISAPKASVTYGAAGLAYALLRLARAREDTELLALADVWSQRATALAPEPEAFYNAEFEIDVSTVGRSSPYHTLSGVHWVSACVSHARADVVGFNTACHAAALASEDLSENPDLTLGRAGTLLAYASLIDLARSVPLAETDFLQTAGDAIAAELEAYLDSLPPVAEASTFPFLGIAHGWAGIVYALLRWREATGSSVGAGLSRRLDELADLAEPADDGLHWPRRSRAGGVRTVDFVPSWCNGSAGFVHLWLTADRVLGGDGYGKLAIGAALDAVGPSETGSDLCCGLAGRAYALLALHRATGDGHWLKETRRLALRAIRPRLAESPFALSLYKGAIGAAVLAADLREPASASMPLFEAEGWAAGGGP